MDNEYDCFGVWCESMAAAGSNSSFSPTIAQATIAAPSFDIEENDSYHIPDYQISSLSEAQDKALALLPLVPSILSAWGSANIIYMFFQSKKRTSYRRIMLGLSCSDFVNTLILTLQPFLLPKETSQRRWASGNDATCSAMGFFMQLFFINVWYNAGLSLYFLLLVKYNVKEPLFERKYEPWMHLLCIGYPLVTAILGAAIGLYNEIDIGQGCWVANYPEGCGCLDDPEAVCCESKTYAWFFAGIPTLVSFILIVTNNLVVYCHVRSTIHRSRAHISSEMVLASRMSMSSVRTPRDPQLRRIRAVAVQASLYVAAFLITYSPSMALRVMESTRFDPQDEAKIYPLLVAAAITLPLQGFFNCLIYARPTYLRARKDFPRESRYWAFRRAIYGEEVQPTDEPGESSLFEVPARVFYPSVGDKFKSKANSGISELQMSTLGSPSHPLVSPSRQEQEPTENELAAGGTSRGKWTGLLLSWRTGKDDRPPVSALVGSEFDAIDVSPRPPKRVKSSAEHLPVIPTRRYESSLMTEQEEQWGAADQVPSKPMRLATSVEDDDDCECEIMMNASNTERTMPNSSLVGSELDASGLCSLNNHPAVVRRKSGAEYPPVVPRRYESSVVMEEEDLIPSKPRAGVEDAVSEAERTVPNSSVVGSELDNVSATPEPLRRRSGAECPPVVPVRSEKSMVMEKEIGAQVPSKPMRLETSLDDDSD